MSEILDEYKVKPKSSIPLKLLMIFFIAVILVIIFGIYVGNVLFGERSYVVLKSLQKERVYLTKDIQNLQKENSKLHKIYLERTSLDPDLKP